MNLFSVFVSLMTYLGYIFFTRCLYFYHNWWSEIGKNQFFKYFWRILHKVEVKVLEIYKHCRLSITWILKKSNSKFTFDNSNSRCLEHFLFLSNNYLDPLQILSYRELNVVAPISSLAIHKILFSFSWLAILILILKSTYCRDFQHKTISRIFVQLSKKPPYFCPLEVILKKIASIASYCRYFSNFYFIHWTTGN